jgi:hypothetical protein
MTGGVSTARRITVGRLVLLAVFGTALGFCCWFFGVDPWYAVAFALVIVALGVAWAALGGADVPDWADDPVERPPGARDDVVRLAWSLRMHKGQVHEQAFKRVRALASERFAASRLDIDEPADRAAIEQLIGATGYRALHAPQGRMPSLTAVEICLDALDAVAGDPSPPRPPGLSDPVRDAVAGILGSRILGRRTIAALLARRRQFRDR